ncbi:hypothetical protein GCM10010965_29770 [Caldalkalibacillus thermarum]|uniref:outer membrane protein assembly factor BamB family protein n=1 Tax=Caldalkalibacillus thermarum TaxID=296745 RepID=UPI00166C6FFA|nr:PQQ-binding-like beta-propeller repeat protein [Caldalkalibacillus thermarum]GGK34862.1 hypothetical protein GCM10010965_29770 [Caldalkalibacillus thermarum]
MKRISLFVLALLVFLQPLAVEASNWPAFGRDDTRQRTAVDQKAMPPLYKKWEVENIGWSISSPVTDGTYIYHVAGGFLYKIPLNLNFYDQPLTVSSFLRQRGINNEQVQRVRISDNPHVASHPTYDPIRNRIYVGTGDNRVARINPSTMRIERWFSAGARVVAAPTVLGEDLLVYSTGERARLFLAKHDQRDFINYGDSPAEITGTVAVKQTSRGPIIFVPINYRGQNRPGFVDAIRVIDRGRGRAPGFEFVWSRPFRTDNGVAASIVYDERRDRIYFADKSGAVYAVNASTGRQVWKNTRYRHSSSATTMVNNSPALYGDTLVIPYRYQGGRNRGMIAAFNVTNGQVRWARTSAGEPLSTGNYQGEISSAPVIIVQGNQRIVLFGNTRGVLRAVNLSNGQARPVARQGNRDLMSVRFEGGRPESIYQGQGIATEIMVANGHIVFGANDGATPNRSGNNGNLYAFSTEDFPFMMPLSLTGRVHAQETIPQGAPLPVYFGPWNIGTRDINQPFSVRLYVNNVMVREERYNRLRSGELIGQWITVPAQVATPSRGKKEIRLEVDVRNEVDEPVRSDNIIRRYYEVTPAIPINCPEGFNWEGDRCVKRWTEHRITDRQTRAIRVR